MHSHQHQTSLSIPEFPPFFQTYSLRKGHHRGREVTNPIPGPYCKGRKPGYNSLPSRVFHCHWPAHKGGGSAKSISQNIPPNDSTSSRCVEYHRHGDGFPPPTPRNLVMSSNEKKEKKKKEKKRTAKAPQYPLMLLRIGTIMQHGCKKRNIKENCALKVAHYTWCKSGVLRSMSTFAVHYVMPFEADIRCFVLNTWDLIEARKAPVFSSQTLKSEVPSLSSTQQVGRGRTADSDTGPAFNTNYDTAIQVLLSTQTTTQRHRSCFQHKLRHSDTGPAFNTNYDTATQVLLSTQTTTQVLLSTQTTTQRHRSCFQQKLLTTPGGGGGGGGEGWFAFLWRDSNPSAAVECRVNQYDRKRSKTVRLHKHALLQEKHTHYTHSVSC